MRTDNRTGSKCAHGCWDQEELTSELPYEMDTKGQGKLGFLMVLFCLRLLQRCLKSQRGDWQSLFGGSSLGQQLLTQLLGNHKHFSAINFDPSKV